MKKVTDLGEKEVIHCRTEEEANAICKLMHEAGLSWCTGDSYLDDNKWYGHNEMSCYNPNNGVCYNIYYYEKRDCKIYPASDFLEPEFKNGDEVEYQDRRSCPNWIPAIYVGENPKYTGDEMQCKHVVLTDKKSPNHLTFAMTVRKRTPNIEITVKINGKEAKLSDISEDTLKKLKEIE